MRYMYWGFVFLKRRDAVQSSIGIGFQSTTAGKWSYGVIFAYTRLIPDADLRRWGYLMEFRLWMNRKTLLIINTATCNVASYLKRMEDRMIYILVLLYFILTALYVHLHLRSFAHIQTNICWLGRRIYFSFESHKFSQNKNPTYTLRMFSPLIDRRFSCTLLSALLLETRSSWSLVHRYFAVVWIYLYNIFRFG